MTYCPVCGHFSSANEYNCSNPNCNVIEKAIHKGKGQKMLQATTENRFCGYCNKIFAPEQKICHWCEKATYSLTPSHLQKDVILLSGMAAKSIWEHG